jgi:hypothetical protein
VSRALAALLGASFASACRPAWTPDPPPSILVSLPLEVPSASAASRAPVELPPSCGADADCGFDPAADRCVADARANRQPAIVDQGIACYCERARCETLRVPPVPCETDASCAVDEGPRPHPVAANRQRPHEQGKPCRDFRFSTTCERTNICTMHRLACRTP